VIAAIAVSTSKSMSFILLLFNLLVVLEPLRHRRADLKIEKETFAL
jgi:hypothetical protein